MEVSLRGTVRQCDHPRKRFLQMHMAESRSGGWTGAGAARQSKPETPRHRSELVSDAGEGRVLPVLTFCQ
jgi:hypothetical protein